MILDELAVPIVLAPLAGGPSTPQLAAAVSAAGGLGFLGAGYLTPMALADRLGQTRALTGAPFGVNLFMPGEPAAPGTEAAYAATLADETPGAAGALGKARSDEE